MQSLVYLRVDALLWEPGERGNEAHLTRQRPGKPHISRAEIDAIYASGRYTRLPHDHWYPDGSYELQALLIGRDPTGRVLAVVCQVTDIDGREHLRPITAWIATTLQEEAYHDDYPND